MKLTYEECENLWNAKTKENPLVVDSEEGVQVMKWLTLRNSRRVSVEAPMIHSRQPFVSPIDGKVIASAQGVRDHEKEHGVTQVGDEYVGIVNEKRAEREQLRSDTAARVREAEKNGMRPNDNFNWQ